MKKTLFFAFATAFVTVAMLSQNSTQVIASSKDGILTDTTKKEKKADPKATSNVTTTTTTTTTPSNTKPTAVNTTAKPADSTKTKK